MYRIQKKYIYSIPINLKYLQIKSKPDTKKTRET